MEYFFFRNYGFSPRKSCSNSTRIEFSYILTVTSLRLLKDAKVASEITIKFRCYERLLFLTGR